MRIININIVSLFSKETILEVSQISLCLDFTYTDLDPALKIKERDI